VSFQFWIKSIIWSHLLERATKVKRVLSFHTLIQQTAFLNA
jgi:hypothetical protein